MRYCDECDIAYDLKNCPLCEANAQIEALEKEVEMLNEEVQNLEKGE
jgi:cell division protein FtsB